MRPGPAAAVCLSTLALAGCSAPPASDPAPSGEGAQVVATVNGRAIASAELDDWIRDDLFEREIGSKSPGEQYEERKRALDRMVLELVIAAEAERTGASEEEVVERAVEALDPVGDEQIAEFFEKNRARLPEDAELEDFSGRIRRVLESQRTAEARKALRASADVEIALAPPRIEIEAVGPALGPENAPVTIVEFSDYECPFCRRAEPTIQAVLERYPEQVRLVFRHMPLDAIHPRARPAAEAAVCADEQGLFWDFHAKIFENQSALSDEQLLAYGQEVGLDAARYTECREGDTARAKVDFDLAAAREVGISGTPAFFVNGIPMTGAQPLDAFVRVIEEELARSGAGS